MRGDLRLTQTEFAKQVSISREKLASYEDARVPLKVGLALQICRQFIISEEWLATGLGHFNDEITSNTPFGILGSRLCVNLLNEDISKNLNKNMLFSRAFDEILYERYELLRSKNPFVPRINMTEDDSPSAFQNAFIYLLEVLLSTLDESAQKRLLATLNRSAQILGGVLWEGSGSEKDAVAFENIVYDIFLEYQALGEHYNLVLDREVKKKGLTVVSESVNNIDVTPKLPSLLKRLKEATAQRGKKSALAEFLGVSLVQVSQWLSGDREPGGETTLRLLQWVEQQERQK